MASVNYHEKIKHLQERRQQSEVNRLHLEQQLSVSGITDKMLLKLRAMRLESYWKKICDDERRSKLRNQQILEDLGRLDLRAVEISQQIRALHSIQLMNESYMEQTYPDFLSRFTERLQQQQLQKQASEQQSRPAVQPVADFPQPHTEPKQLYRNDDVVQPGARQEAVTPRNNREARPSSPLRPVEVHQPRRLTADNSRDLAGSPVPAAAGQQQFGSHRSPDDVIEDEWDRSVASRTAMSVAESVASPRSRQQQGVASNAAGLVSSEQALPAPSSTSQEKLSHGGVNDKRNSVSNVSVDDVSAGTVSKATPPPRRSKADTGKRASAAESAADGGSSEASPKVVAPPRHSKADRKSSDVSQYSATSTGVLSALASAAVIASAVASSNSAVDAAVTPRSRGSRAASPTSSAGFPSPRRVKSSSQAPSLTNSPRKSPKKSDSLSLKAAAENQQDKKAVTDNEVTASASAPIVVVSSNANDDDLDPVLTLDGFCHLLAAIEGEIQRNPRKLSTGQLYSLTGSLPQEGVFFEIIDLSNRLRAMSHINLASLCQVAFRQLSPVCQTTHDRCLLTDLAVNNLTLTLQSTQTLTEKDVRKQIHPSGSALWDRLFSHLLFLIKYNAASTDELAANFSPLLLASKSRCQDKTVAILSHLLECAAPADDAATRTPSVSDFSLVSSPRKPPSPRKDVVTTSSQPKNNKLTGESDYTLNATGDGASLGNTGNQRNLTGTFGSSLQPNASLRQSAAYQQLLGNTASSMNSTGGGLSSGTGFCSTCDGDEDDDEDDIERGLKNMVAPSPVDVTSAVYNKNAATTPQRINAKPAPKTPTDLNKTTPAISTVASTAAPRLSSTDAVRNKNIVFRVTVDSDIDGDEFELPAVPSSLNRSTASLQQSGQQRPQSQLNNNTAAADDGGDLSDDDFWSESIK